MNLNRTRAHPRPRPVGRRVRGERGIAAALVALMIVPMLAFAAMGVDVAGWYVFGQRLQRAADAAATAGVAHLPDIVQATSEAIIAVERNGVDVDDPDIDVYVAQEGTDLQLRVTVIDRNVDRYLSAMFDENVTIARTAVARYVPTIPFGSNNNTYGDILPDGCEDINAGCAGTGPKVGWWASINGPKTGHSSGDPYATQCLTGEGSSCDNANSYYRSTGYLMAIDVPAAAVGSTVTVEIFDAPYFYRSDLTGPTAGVGDGGASSSALAPHTRFTVFDADGSPIGFSTSTEISGCAQTYLDGYESNGATLAATYRARWTTLCTFIPSQEDVYPLRIQTSGFTGANASATGWNNYSLRVTSSSGSNPHLYGISDMSIHANQENTSSFDLAEIAPDYAGKVMSLLLFDSGDGQGSTTFTLTPTPPPGVSLSSCQYRSWSVGGAFSSWATATPCEITTRQSGTSLYNDKWLEIRVPIPTTYTCTDCWWSIVYDTGGGTFFERTVWSINIDSDPLRLIE